VTELAPGESAAIGAVTVTAVEADHPTERRFDRGGEAIGFLLSGSRRVYFAGDTDLFDGMRGLCPDLDLALLPIWGWGTGLGPGHMDPGEAARAAALLLPGLVVPIHWATYLPFHLRRHRGLLATPGEEFARLTAELAPGVPVEVVRPGSTVAVPARV
jgi:L-ascorbate metabolism protein UlaG (beta-lactamase superfamily)